MPSTFRIPQAPLDGVYGRIMTKVAERLWGEVPDNARVLFHHRPVTRAVFGFEQKVARWKALDPHLKTYAQMAAAAQIGCSWCLDFGYFLAHEEGLTLEKVREVPRWRDSDAFTDLERDVMGYAEAMTATPPTVDDAMVAGLDAALGHRAMVELTMIIAVENERSRFNSALGLASQGYADRCELAPLAVPSTP
jgi:AhpD family alkylhydroperoxidase